MSFYSNNKAAGLAAKSISSQARSIHGNNLLGSCKMSQKDQKENQHPLLALVKADSNQNSINNERHHMRPQGGQFFGMSQGSYGFGGQGRQENILQEIDANSNISAPNLQYNTINQQWSAQHQLPVFSQNSRQRPNYQMAERQGQRYIIQNQIVNGDRWPDSACQS